MSSRNCFVLGILGAIGSGKTEVSKLFGEFGAYVISADYIVHRLLTEKYVCNKIAQMFNIKIPPKDEDFRKEISDIIFNSTEARKKLENLLHPYVEKKIKIAIEKCKKETNNRMHLIILDVPLLLEAKMEKYCDKLLFVSTAENFRMKRLQEKRKLSASDIQIRQQFHLPLSYKKKTSDLTVYNDGNLNQTRIQVQKIIEKIVNKKHIE